MTAVVEFVGLPGTGKTTVSRKVADILARLDIPVSEPTHEIEGRQGFHRVSSKALFAARGFTRAPVTGIALTRAAISTHQQSSNDLVRVLFNILYVTGVITTHRSVDGACLLDQGPYQGVWSVGFRSSHEWTDILERFSKTLHITNPDLIVFVEADEKTISDRLNERTGGDTRLEPGSNAFERGIEGYEQIKSYVLSAEHGPRSIVVENEIRDTLQSSAIRIADEILALEDQDRS